MSKIFVSYSSQSKPIATSLVTDFRNLGHDVWFDQELSGGQPWWDQILATIRDCHVFVYVLEPNALNSTACKREVSYAAELGKSILPVLVADGVSTNLLPRELSVIQFIDYREQDRNTVFRLVKALNNIPPSKPLPDPLPSPPDVPVSYLGGLARKIDSVPTLSFEEQSALVVDLKMSLRDLATRDDTHTLLEKLRSRRDLFATIATEIDDLLARPSRAPPDRSEPTEKMDDITGKQKQESNILPLASSLSPKPKTTLRQRLLGASVAAIVGVVLASIAAIIVPRSTNFYEWLNFNVVISFIFAITGAIVGTDKRLFVFAIAGYILGFTFLYLSAGGPSNVYQRFAGALTLGGSISAILGAIVGTIMRRIRGWA